PLWTIGVLQYVTPTIQFLLGVLAYDEDWSGGQVVGYSIIWIGLAAFAAEGVTNARRSRATAESIRR
ncbi:MAG: EamA family transporter RarD, partial [Actinomycetota bacterium]